MWGTFLSEPLSIVGLVGRYPANCLMERMPIYQRWIFNKYPHAGPLFYAVLVRLSPGYPPLIGKLHTRYSPVRRSPTRCCHLSLPLDLHVLSLSLAFILSQDQTLLCCYLVFLFSLWKFTTTFYCCTKTKLLKFWLTQQTLLFKTLLNWQRNLFRLRLASLSSRSLVLLRLL